MQCVNSPSVFVVLTVLVAILAGCDNSESDTTDLDVSAKAPSIGEFQLVVPEPEPDPSNSCTDPRPPNIGCTTMCKPCVTFLCVNGEWVRDEVDFGELCNPIEDLPPVACPLTKVTTGTGDNQVTHEFCAADCSICF